jgi:hypothetical protein
MCDSIMPIYSLSRHVIYKPGCQETIEVWGIDRPAHGIKTVCAPRDTDADDPLRSDRTFLLKLECGDYVTWDRMFEWLSEIEEHGYEVISGFEKMSPYTNIIIRERKNKKD